MKLCSKCQISKNETEFYWCSKSPDGRYYQCKACANPEKYLISKSKRRASETAAYDVTEKDLRGILRRQYQQCAICSACMGARMTLDHIVPLSKGGQHRVGNLQYLCSTCNFRKNDRWLAVARRSILSVDPDTGEVVP